MKSFAFILRVSIKTTFRLGNLMNKTFKMFDNIGENIRKLAANESRNVV